MPTQNHIVPFEATHPGVLIKDELDARPDMKQMDLAKQLGVKASFLNEIIKGKRPITADMAILLEKMLEIPADYWMRFQSQYEIDKARLKEKNIARIRNIELWDAIKKHIPVSYLKKNGLLSDNLEEDIQTVKSVYEIDNVEDLALAYVQDKINFQRKSEKLQINK